jgi:hypothetical protein
MRMRRLPALMRSKIRDGYWGIYSMPIWDRLRQLYDSHFKKTHSYDVDANFYNFLFLSPPPSLDIFADSRVWDRAAVRLPDGYTIPDQASLDVLLPMNGDYYGSLFSNPLPMYGIYVDGSVWKNIKTAVPEPYVIPDLASIRILEPMTAEYYNSFFTVPVRTYGIVIDGKVWGKIAAALPQDFRLPDSAIVDALKKNRQEVGL